jgi:hypothetical protein
MPSAHGFPHRRFAVRDHAAAVVAPAEIAWRRVLGAFQLPVRTKEVLLLTEERDLSVLRWIAEAIGSTLAVETHGKQDQSDAAEGQGCRRRRVKRPRRKSAARPHRTRPSRSSFAPPKKRGYVTQTHGSRPRAAEAQASEPSIEIGGLPRLRQSASTRCNRCSVTK